MTNKTSRWIRLGLMLSAGAAVGIGVATNTFVLPLIALPLAVAASLILTRFVQDRIKDERLIRLSNSAARWSFAIYSVAAAGTGAVLVSLDRTAGPMWWAGMVLTISVFFMMLVYYVLYFIFTRKY
jgi:uncharacterized membrane protein